MTRVVPIDIEGLDLILGGGLPLLKRDQDLDESATLLVRGPPGSGKTIFGAQIAGSLARSLGCDVAYGCVELLPTELAAQHAGIKRADVPERVVVAPFSKEERKAGECRLFAAVLNLGSPGEEPARLDQAVADLLGAIERSGGRPRVLVIDSLSDGYNLGSRSPRALADALCKMAAQRGMVLVLLEEISESTPSAWSFATDVVFELRTRREEPFDRADDLQRTINVVKNRLGPADPGPHRVDLLPGRGFTVRPRPSAYASSWSSRLVLPNWEQPRVRQAWKIDALDKAPGWPSFEKLIVAVHGADADGVTKTASRIGDDPGAPGTDVLLTFRRAIVESKAPWELANDGSRLEVSLGYPYIGGDRVLATTLQALEFARQSGRCLRRVLIGDLRAMRTFWNAPGIRRALMVLVSVLRRVAIPTILFETAPPHMVMSMTPGGAHGYLGPGAERTGIEEPSVVDFADVVIEVVSERELSDRTRFVATYIPAGQSIRWSEPSI